MQTAHFPEKLLLTLWLKPTNRPNNRTKNNTYNSKPHLRTTNMPFGGNFGTCGICHDSYCVRKLLIVNVIAGIIASRLIGALLREVSSRSAFSPPTDVHRNHRGWGFFFHNLCHKMLFFINICHAKPVFYAQTSPKQA